MSNKTKIILDTDPGIDDAVAIAIALFSEEIDVKLITTVAGNVSIDKTTKNALNLTSFFNKKVPVAQGAHKPLIRPLEDGSSIHGHSGLDGYEFKDSKENLSEKNAVEAMKEVILDSTEPITLVPVGPLTNIALLLTLYPQCKNNIERIVLMGGSASGGNRTPAAEYNIFADPEAAKIVFEAGLKIVMCGLDVTNKAVITKEDMEEIKALNKTGEMLYSLFKHYRSGSIETGLRMHDSCAIAYLLKPELFQTKDCFVTVETLGEYTFGETIVDINNVYKKEPNASVCLNINVDGFRRWLIDSLRKGI
ncbi:ribonucleoside hydrolase RihC [Desnuesiella massiliensis]|uniref:ribonucleoside hydrolase RihC n=1 Tax=Desnuesiella massiliensis TaxID=1650662 RepID=UPI0006E423EF|nr:ribonucleoside hydrolase RihC [Desnuesiella massiliensis]